jgi:uncharacterized protein YndB with AHSA1/START domain
LHINPRRLEVIADSIERDVLIESPLDVVWGVVTEPDHISQWFSEQAEVDLRPGGDGALRWEEYGAIPFTVDTVEPAQTFSFRWVHPAGDVPRAGNSMLVEFTLTGEGEHTRLRVVESGLLGLDWDEGRKAQYLDDHERGWDVHLADLREYMAARAPAATSR